MQGEITRKPLSIEERVARSRARGVQFHRMCLDDETAHQVLREHHWQVLRSSRSRSWVVLDEHGAYLAGGKSPRAAIEHALVPRRRT